MEVALPDPAASPEAAWSVCERLLSTARAEGSVLTILWHLRYFSQADFPGYRDLYRRVVERALEMGAWVGPPRSLLAAVRRHRRGRETENGHRNPDDSVSNHGSGTGTGTDDSLRWVGLDGGDPEEP